MGDKNNQHRQQRRYQHYENKEPKFNYSHKKVSEYILDNNGKEIQDTDQSGQNVYKVTSRQSTMIVKKIGLDSQAQGNDKNFPVTLTAIGNAANNAFQILQTYKQTDSIVGEVEIKISTLIMKFEAEPIIQGLETFKYETVNGKISIKFNLKISNNQIIEETLNTIHLSNRVSKKRSYRNNNKQRFQKNRGYKSNKPKQNQGRGYKNNNNNNNNNNSANNNNNNYNNNNNNNNYNNNNKERKDKTYDQQQQQKNNSQNKQNNDHNKNQHEGGETNQGRNNNRRRNNYKKEPNYQPRIRNQQTPEENNKQ